ncbi:MAG: fibronectin type III domain-containing protein [Desulfamplus sp.]
MKLKKATLFYGLLAVVLSVILGNTSVYSELCNNQNSSMCMEALDKNNMAIDEKSSFLNTNSVAINFKAIPYGKAVIDQLQLYNSGYTDVITISSNTALSFPWAYFDIQGNDYVASEVADYIWSLYSSSGLVIKSGNRKSFDIAFAPLPEGEGLSKTEAGKFSGMQSHLFQQWNPFDVRLNSMSFEVTTTGYTNGSLGKKFSVDVNDLGGSSGISITPDMTNVNLEANEYILAYFEIIQKDGNPYKEVIVLHQDETAILAKSLISGQVDNSGITAAYSHRQFANGNVLLRSRDTKNETKTKYWLLFKSSDPIILQCYKKTINSTGSSQNTYGAAEADLKFIYADLEGKQVEELKGVYAGDNNSTPTNRQPYTPSNPTPSNNSTNISFDNLTLNWTGGDPDGNNVTDTVYFSDSAANITSSANLLPFPYTPTVINGKTYYWKVVSTDGLLTTEGPIWAFTVSDNTTPVEKKAVEFFNSSGLNISQSGLSLKKGDSATITVKIDPPNSNLSFDLVSSDSNNIQLSATSLVFTSMSSSATAFTIKANNDITAPVTISLNTTNQDYKKDDGTPYTITITGNNPPQITSNGGGDTASISVEDGQVNVTTITANYTGNSLSYSITGGADESKFIIYDDGFLRFVNPSDFANPTDANKDNIYNVIIKVTDSNGLADSQEIAVTVIEDNGDANESPKLSDTSRVPENRSIITTDTTTLSWIKATDKEGASLTYAVEYWTLADKSDKKIITEVKEVGNTEQVELTGLKDNTTYNWLVWVYDGKNAAFGTEWLFSVKLPKVPLPASNIMAEVNPISEKPVTPTTANPIAQPLAAGNLTQGITLSYSYPAYNAPVDIYVVMYYKNQFLFITKDGDNFIPTTEVKPLFYNAATAESGSIFSIPNGLLKTLGLTGEYIFLSGVTPAGDTGFNKYDITWFSLNVAP